MASQQKQQGGSRQQQQQSRPAGLKAPPAIRPQLVVFDLDMCMWHPEMYELPGKPMKKEMGQLGTAGEGVVGAVTASGDRRWSHHGGSGGATVRLFPGALKALQELYLLPEWQDTKVAAASSSEEPSYSAACLDMLEILPGVPMREVFSFFAIGRRGELSSDKRTHFKKIQRESKVVFREMLFFDDCNWGDHVRKIEQAHGVLGVRTPGGMQEEEWREGLRRFADKRGG